MELNLMNNYGLSAIKAVQILQSTEDTKPLTAWNTASTDLFGAGSFAQKKGCPKNAFLGLCEEGFVEGIAKGDYTYKPSSLNKEYALKAVELLRVNSQLANDKSALRKEVMQGVKKSHNSQMDVVIALWNNDLIVLE